MSQSSKCAQKSWLVLAKNTLSNRHSGLTWDNFAKLINVDPRAFKTYRMPEESENYRTMPVAIKKTITDLLSGDVDINEDDQDTLFQANPSNLLIPALAALVIRQANLSLIENRMIAGITRTARSPIGLTSEDRRAMGAISRACLENQLEDVAAEIHDLLFLCTQPLGQWLKIPEVLEKGLSEVVLIHVEEGVPTVEAEELASKFTGMTAGIEEQLFAQFMEIIGRYHADTANEYYTTIREFVVRHPTCTSDEIKELGNDLPSILWLLIQQQFYEQVPTSWVIKGTKNEVPRCNFCGNCLKPGKAGLLCRTTACVASNPISSYTMVPANDLLRVSRGIRQYWVEPGIDEIRLYDALINQGLAATLYPFRDRVDISVGKVGLDLKTYTSPETLGAHFKKGIGGLSYYEHKWVVIPDWQINSVPSYMDRLKRAIDRPELVCMSLSEALTRLVNHEGHYA